MTTHLEKTARTGGTVASFPARKTQIPRIVPAAALAIVVASAALFIYVGTNPEVPPAIQATQVQQVPPLENWAPPESNAAGIEYSPANPYVRPETNWAVPETNAAGIEYSPANPYVPSETAPAPSTRHEQQGPR